MFPGSSVLKWASASRIVARVSVPSVTNLGSILYGCVCSSKNYPNGSKSCERKMRDRWIRSEHYSPVYITGTFYGLPHLHCQNGHSFRSGIDIAFKSSDCGLDQQCLNVLTAVSSTPPSIKNRTATYLRCIREHLHFFLLFVVVWKETPHRFYAP